MNYVLIWCFHPERSHIALQAVYSDQLPTLLSWHPGLGETRLPKNTTVYRGKIKINSSVGHKNIAITKPGLSLVPSTPSCTAPDV